MFLLWTVARLLVVTMLLTLPLANSSSWKTNQDLQESQNQKQQTCLFVAASIVNLVVFDDQVKKTAQLLHGHFCWGEDIDLVQVFLL